MERKDYTLHAYKFDKRYKGGEILVAKREYLNKTQDEMASRMEFLEKTLYLKTKFRMELHETYVTRTNIMTGLEYQERYDTPACCSPSREVYWSM